MKNKAVELMVRCQFNIPDSQSVDVEFLHQQESTYHFEAFWLEGTVHKQCNLEIKSSGLQSRELDPNAQKTVSPE